MKIKTITLLMVCTIGIVCMLVAAIVVGVVSTFSQKSAETKERVLEAFQQGHWDVPEQYQLYADEVDIANHPSMMEDHEGGWICFPGELRSTLGPWTYTCMLWYNTQTKETHIQKQ